MKNKAVWATLTAAVLMFAAPGFVRADNGGKGGNNGNNNGQNNGNNNGQNNGNNAKVRLRTTLTGAAMTRQKPEGNAEFRNDNGRMRFQVEVENVNLPDGTVLTVTVVDAGVTTTVGMITLRGGEAELELDSQNGDMVPTVMTGDMIAVSNAGAAVLAGVF